MAKQSDKDDRNSASGSLIKCDTETLSQSSSGAITGSIWFEAGDQFPERGWSDFVVVILVWWLKAAASLARRRGSVELQFMDGPYAVAVEANDEGTCSVEFVNTALTRTVIGTSTVETLRLIQGLTNVAKEVVEECTRREFQSTDLDELRAVLRSESQSRRH